MEEGKKPEGRKGVMMMAEKNGKAKTRPVDNPYEVYKSGDWEWRVLKHYQAPEKERANPLARVLVAAKSPATFGSWEYGDTYLKDIPGASRVGSDIDLDDLAKARAWGIA